MDINIVLDPVNDGISCNTKHITCKDKGALIIGTNGKSRFVGLERVPYELEGLADLSHSEYMEETPYLLIFNANKVFNVGRKRFFVGSVLVLKSEDDGELLPLDRQDCQWAAEEFKDRLVTLVCDGQEFQAYELID